MNCKVWRRAFSSWIRISWFHFYWLLTVPHRELIFGGTQWHQLLIELWITALQLSHQEQFLEFRPSLVRVSALHDPFAPPRSPRPPLPASGARAANGSHFFLMWMATLKVGLNYWIIIVIQYTSRYNCPRPLSCSVLCTCVISSQWHSITTQLNWIDRNENFMYKTCLCKHILIATSFIPI